MAMEKKTAPARFIHKFEVTVECDEQALTDELHPQRIKDALGAGLERDLKRGSDNTWRKEGVDFPLSVNRIFTNKEGISRFL